MLLNRYLSLRSSSFMLGMERYSGSSLRSSRSSCPGGPCCFSCRSLCFQSRDGRTRLVLFCQWRSASGRENRLRRRSPNRAGRICTRRRMPDLKDDDERRTPRAHAALRRAHHGRSRDGDVPGRPHRHRAADRYRLLLRLRPAAHADARGPAGDRREDAAAHQVRTSRSSRR